MRYNIQIIYLRITVLPIIQVIANHLKQLRQARGWSLDKTAEMTGVSKAMLGQIERKNHRRPLPFCGK